MSLEGKSLFNQVTDLMDRANYNREIKESEEMYNYQTTSFKQPICFMNSQNLQGFSVKEPPAAIIDIESYLKMKPLRNEIDRHVFEGDLRNTSPSMPEELKTRLLIPDCADMIDRSYSRDRQADIGFNRELSLGQGVDPHGPKRQVYVASPGMDTRMAMKDEYKRRADAKFGKDQGAIFPMTDIPCKAAKYCMHVSHTSTPTDSTIKSFQPSAPLSTFAQTMGQPMKGANTFDTQGVPMMGSFMSNPVAENSQGPSAFTTQEVLSTIPRDMTLGELAQEYAVRRGCEVDFYNYKSPCASKK
jgi:hypothetical protein